MTAAEWTDAIIDALAKIGGITALAVLACQQFIRGWIGHRFATKADLQKHEQTLAAQADSARLSLRAKALGQLADLRLQHIDALRKACANLSNACIRVHVAQDNAKSPDATEVDRSILMERVNTGFDIFSEFDTAHSAASPHVPQSLADAAFAFARSAHAVLSAARQMQGDDSQLDASHDELATFEQAARQAIVELPLLADQIA